jgi:5-methylcytosine-specific restriction endonuclease McrA
MEKVFCAACKTEFFVKKYRLKKSKNFFCGFSCMSKWRKGKPGKPKKGVTVPCLICKKEVYKIASHVKKTSNHFCSVKCYRIYQPSILKGFKVPEERILRGEKNPNWRGGSIDYRGPNWKEQRSKALSRDRNSCQRCGVSQVLNVHHKIPYETFSDYREANDLDNLITLCQKCHGIAHYEELVKSGKRERYLKIVDSRVCSLCHKEFSPNSNSQQYCHDCHTGSCEFCGKAFHRYWVKLRFCSLSCAGFAKKSRVKNDAILSQRPSIVNEVDNENYQAKNKQ